jgi:hypothetical protein
MMGYEDMGDRDRDRDREVLVGWEGWDGGG